MKKIILINSLLILILILSSIAFAIPAKSSSIYDDNLYSEDKPNIVVTADKPTFTIKLKSNPTTGYSWFLRDYEIHFLTPINHHFEKSNDNFMGAPGYEYWTFRVKPEAFIVPSQTIIRMVYTRPWQSSDSATQLAFHVTTLKKS